MNKKIVSITTLFLSAVLAGCAPHTEPAAGDTNIQGSMDGGSTTPDHGDAHGGLGAVGASSEDAIGIDPTVYLSSWNFNNLPPRERAHYYRETRLPDGRLLREYWITAYDREIEVAPGVTFQAWTYNGQVPGPTIRATDGDRIRIHFTNGSDRPHTMHFHGFHPAAMDGSAPDQFVLPGGTFLYEFDADPVGLHLYHCHATPLAAHIHKGLYGVYIVDPKTPRAKARELVMMMDGFDVNYDGSNDVYAVNAIAFYYMHHPIRVGVGEPVRIYLVNILEFDETNSFHVHGHFFDEFRTGTLGRPNAYTDVILLGPAERSILELNFRSPGRFMFHAHKSEFAELGWMGMFEADDRRKEAVK